MQTPSILKLFISCLIIYKRPYFIHDNENKIYSQLPSVQTRKLSLSATVTSFSTVPLPTIRGSLFILCHCLHLSFDFFVLVSQVICSAICLRQTIHLGLIFTITMNDCLHNLQQQPFPCASDLTEWLSYQVSCM